MTHLEIIYCIDVVMKTQLLIMSVLLGCNCILTDKIFAWFVLLNVVYIFALLECLYGLLEIFYMTYLF